MALPSADPASFFCRGAHDLAQVGHGRCSSFCDNLTYGVFDLFGRHLPGQVFLEDRNLGQFHVGQIPAVLPDIDIGTLLALFHHLLYDLDDIDIRNRMGRIPGGTFRQKDFGFDASYGIQACRIVGSHGSLQVLLNLFFQSHIVRC
jgi:hypothetical protein